MLLVRSHGGAGLVRSERRWTGAVHGVQAQHRSAAAHSRAVAVGPSHLRRASPSTARTATREVVTWLGVASKNQVLNLQPLIEGSPWDVQPTSADVLAAAQDNGTTTLLPLFDGVRAHEKALSSALVVSDLRGGEPGAALLMQTDMKVGEQFGVPLDTMASTSIPPW